MSIWLSLPKRLWGMAFPAGPLCELLGKGQYRELLALATRRLLQSGMPLPNNFSNDDVVSVYWYTHQTLRTLTYKSLNAVLWGQYRPAKRELLEMCAHLTVALEKLPAYRGPCWRTSKFDVTSTAPHPTGRVIQYPAFTSTSREPRRMPPSGGTYIEVEVRTGRYIGGLSRFPDEQEVLLLPGTIFEVLTNRLIGGIREIHMVEL